MSNHSYSRRRPKSKGEIAQPTERVAQDAVTGKLTVTPLDGVQLAFEAAWRALEGAIVRHRLTAPEAERLADKVCELAFRLRRHTEADLAKLRDLLAGMNGRQGA